MEIIEYRFCPKIIKNENLFNIGLICREMAKAVYTNALAKNAVNLVYYNIMGKHVLNVPVYYPFCGKLADRMPLHGCIRMDKLENVWVTPRKNNC